MAELTANEKKWMAKLEKVLAECPSSLKRRAESYTTGDDNIVIFDERIHQDTGCGVCTDVDNSNAELARVRFPFGVWSTAG